MESVTETRSPPRPPTPALFYTDRLLLGGWGNKNGELVSAAGSVCLSTPIDLIVGSLDRWGFRISNGAASASLWMTSAPAIHPLRA